jgi:hypothetical protein
MSQTMLGLILGGLALAWVVLFFITFRAPAPRVSQLLAFVGVLIVTGILAYFFVVRIMGVNPNPARVWMARELMYDRMIYLGDIVPGIYDLSDIERLDTDEVEEPIAEEWVAYFQYDVRQAAENVFVGPFGAAIYDYNNCRPPAILSFPLVPVAYDYLGQNGIVAVVENIIAYPDPVSSGKDLPEVIVVGYTRGVATDLNVFRRQGVPLSCDDAQAWQADHPGISFPNPLRYQNIGSFRANESVRRSGAVVIVRDRSPFERSQIVIQRHYRPQNGSYYLPGTETLLDPVEASLAFSSGLPEALTQVYYPEKTVLAFYNLLGKDAANLERAEDLLSADAQAIYDIETDQFGVHMSRADLARVLVREIRYVPDAEAERLHQTREVTVAVLGVDADGNIDYAHPCEVTWSVVGVENPAAQPFGCEWRLETYWSTCVPGK